MTISCSALEALAPSSARRSAEPASKTTISFGSAGNSSGGTTISVGGKLRFPGTEKGEPKEATTSLPSLRAARPRASIEPRASPSGPTWQARATVSASLISLAAVAISFILALRRLGEFAENGHDSLPSNHPRVDGELQRWGVLDSNLPPDRGLETVRGTPQGCQSGLVVLGAEHVDVDHGCAQVGSGVDAGDRDHLKTGIAELLHFLGKHLAEDRVHPEHPVTHEPHICPFCEWKPPHNSQFRSQIGSLRLLHLGNEEIGDLDLQARVKVVAKLRHLHPEALPVGCGDRDPEGGPLPTVVMVDLGDAVRPQPPDALDHGAQHRPLSLE